MGYTPNQGNTSKSTTKFSLWYLPLTPLSFPKLGHHWDERTWVPWVPKDGEETMHMGLGSSTVYMRVLEGVHEMRWNRCTLIYTPGASIDRPLRGYIRGVHELPLTVGPGKLLFCRPDGVPDHWMDSLPGLWRGWHAALDGPLAMDLGAPNPFLAPNVSCILPNNQPQTVHGTGRYAAPLTPTSTTPV